MDSNASTTTNKAFRVGLGDITPNNLGQLKRLNTVLFPIVYAPSFYKEVLEVDEFAKIIYFNDVCVGARLLKHIVENAELATGPQVHKIYLHVQTNNEEAVEFYKKHGFQITETCENYYPQLEVGDAYKLEKVITAAEN
ncbi:N-alpha-acetyltransferase 50 [Lunasporangiospora selenospora]|uniref:N-alpha-acetyltransferase 50 n=1 Tax=Lunasporangiospora selenospora TaxID=979761 RepID=A0A9P6FPR0_9FUNG|nr:N-alpha-acetyltransferase 50 [Lunasporangiospora selenospora]